MEHRDPNWSPRNTAAEPRPDDLRRSSPPHSPRPIHTGGAPPTTRAPADASHGAAALTGAGFPQYRETTQSLPGPSGPAARHRVDDPALTQGRQHGPRYRPRWPRKAGTEERTPANVGPGPSTTGPVPRHAHQTRKQQPREGWPAHPPATGPGRTDPAPTMPSRTPETLNGRPPGALPSCGA